MSSKAAISLATGPEDGERVIVALLVVVTPRLRLTGERRHRDHPGPDS